MAATGMVVGACGGIGAHSLALGAPWRAAWLRQAGGHWMRTYVGRCAGAGHSSGSFMAKMEAVVSAAKVSLHSAEQKCRV